VTSLAKYELAISSFYCGYDDLQGIRAIMYAKAVAGDPEFMYAVSNRRYYI